MKTHDFKNRVVYPVLSVFVTAAVSYVAYFGSRHIEHYALHQIIAAVFGTTYFLSVAFGALYVYATAYLRGAGLVERV